MTTTLKEYQAFLVEYSKAYFNLAPTRDHLAALSLGLAGEAGETVELIKRVFRGDRTMLDVTEELTKELGDVLAYVLLLCWFFEIDVDELVATNVTKLSQRLLDKK